MRIENVGIVTITLARTSEEERTLLSALTLLSRSAFPSIAADGGSRPDFLRQLNSLGISVVRPPAKGLVAQVKAAISAALDSWPGKFLLYTEPDKYPFFGDRLPEFIRRSKAGRSFGIALASRDRRSFKTFPKGQQWTESFMNQAASLVLDPGRTVEQGDYCYGPLLLSPRAAKLALESPDDLGWGWRFYSLARAKQLRLKLTPIIMDLPCPQEQRSEDSRGDRLYRVKQLRQNLAALELASTK